MKLFKLAALLLLSAALASAAGAAEEIRNFDVTMALSADGSMAVREKLQFNVENKTIVHGIRRRIVSAYRLTSADEAVTMPYRVVGVTLDGQPVEHQEDEGSTEFVIKIGSGSSTVPRGVHTYEIRYETRDYTRFFADHDEMYWNATGSDWQWPILRASFQMSLPDKKAGQGFKKIEWYTGPHGSREGYMKNAVRQGDGSVVTTQTLAPKEGLTVVYSFEKGLIARPKPAAANGEPAAAAEPPLPPDDLKKTGIAGAVWGIVATALMGLLWLCRGRPRRKTVIPLFDPPLLDENGKKVPASPGTLRVARSLRPDSACLTSALLDLAVGGWLVFHRKKDGSLSIEKMVRKKGGALPLVSEDERYVFSQLDGTIETAEKKSRRNLAKIAAELEGRGEKLAAECLENGYRRARWLVWLLVYAGLTAMAMAGGVDNAVSLAFTALWTLPLMLTTARRLICPGIKGGWRRGMSLFFFILSASPLFTFTLANFDEPNASMIARFTYALVVPLLCLLAALMARRSERGAQLLADAEGMRMYLNTAERAQLEFFNPPEETQERVVRFLPYAFALDAAKTWANKLDGSLRPGWYVDDNDRGGIWDFVMVSSALDSINTSVDAAIAPESSGWSSGSDSGSDGGGWSDGGGGGGGGDGW